MKNLTTEVTNVLNNPNVRTGLNIAKIEATSLISKKKSKSSFEDTFKLARLINESAEYFKTKECKQISIFTHVSTAYVNCTKTGLIEEKIYNPDVEIESFVARVMAMTPLAVKE